MGVWQPAIYRSDLSPTIFKLPCPVTQLRIQLRGQQKEHFVPLRRELLSYGLTNAYREITVSGTTNIDDNGVSPVTSRAELDDWELLETLGDYVEQYNVPPGEGFEFGWYRQTSPAFHRKLIDCVVTDYTFDIGDDSSKPFQYSLTIIARNPEIKTTALGV